MDADPESPLGFPPPLLVAMVLAEYVVQDEISGAVTIVGTMFEHRAATFPVVLNHLYIYFVLSEGRGAITVRLRITSQQDWHEGMEVPDHQFEPVEHMMTFESPQQIGEGVFGIYKMSFAKPGKYRFQLFWGRHFLGERSLLVMQEEPSSSR